jgi:hypothetical protein
VIRTFSVGALALASLVLTASPALAKEGIGGNPPEFGENAPRNYESSQWFAFELKFGPYSPNIDASPGLSKLGGHPFRDLFPPSAGKSRPPGRLLTQLEFDFQFLHRWWGNLGIGHTIGYYRRTSHSLEYTNPTAMPPTPCDSTTTTCQGSSGDGTSLNVIPMSLLFVYRFDYLAHRWNIPFVPYFKAGLAYYVWWIENGGGFLSIAKFTDPTTGNTDSGYGGTWGYVLNPGGAFLLDIIDPTAARVLDSELGINHTYLFCELHYADISGFGASNKMNLSDLTLNAGISFEF